MQTFTLEIIAHGDRKTLRYHFDDTQPNEQAVLSFLKGGLFYEPEVAAILMRTLKPGDTVLDVGANVGFFSVLAGALIGEEGRVFCFEPDPENSFRLQENLLLNRLGTAEVINAPVSNQLGQVEFYLNKDNKGGNALWNPGLFPGNDQSLIAPEAISMQATTLDHVAEQHDLQKIKLIKIDTEGSEQLVLEGAEQILAGARVPFIIAELHEFGLAQNGHTQASLRCLMKSRGYDTFALSKDGAMPILIPENTTLTSDYYLNILFSTPDVISEYWSVYKPAPIC
jgi:FkbM family methyltransferase